MKKGIQIVTVGPKSKMLMSHALKLTKIRAPRSYYEDSKSCILITQGKVKKTQSGYSIKSAIRKVSIHRRTNGIIPESLKNYTALTSSIKEKTGKITHKITHAR